MEQNLKESRREKERFWKARQRALETPEKIQFKKKSNSMDMALLRANHTPEQVQQRREVNSRNIAELRANQTPEQAQ
jgi:hypothetical protein